MLTNWKDHVVDLLVAMRVWSYQDVFQWDLELILEVA